MIVHKLLTELVEEYENGTLDLKSLPKMIPCYFTKEHKEKDSVCWTTVDEIISMHVYKQHMEKIKKMLLWGND